MIYSICCLPALFFLLLSCENSPPREESPWSLSGLENQDVYKLRLYGDQLYAITKQRGLYRRSVTKENSDWTYLGFADSVTDRLQAHGVADVYVNPDLPKRIMISTYKIDQYNHSLYISQDDGASWSLSDSTLVYEWYDSLYYAVAWELVGYGDTVYAVCRSRAGLFMSGDFGRKWELVRQQPETSFSRLRIHPLNRQIMWLIWNSFYSIYFYKSTDGGVTWQGPSKSFKDRHTFADDIALDTQDPNTAYISAEGSLYKSEDFGDTWVEITPEDTLYLEGPFITIDSNLPDHLLIIFLYGHDFTTFKPIAESWDAGISWTRIHYPYEFYIYDSPVFDPINEAFYFPTSGGVLRYYSTE